MRSGGDLGCAVARSSAAVARGRVALEALLSEGKLPSRRDHPTDANKTRSRASWPRSTPSVAIATRSSSRRRRFRVQTLKRADREAV